MKNNIAKVLALSMVSGGALEFDKGKPTIDNCGNLIYNPRKLSDLEFIDLLSGQSNENTQKHKKEFSDKIDLTSNENYISMEFMNYKSNENPNKNQSLRDYLTQELTVIQAFKDSIDSKN